MLLLDVRNEQGGVVVPARNLTGGSATLNVSSLTPGTYYVHLTDPRTGATTVKMLVKL
ncbi:MAG: T9SS type A sorting domain-containing protein [Sphingobacteriales bacterium]|nr:MAG: T9SS type A sorting domain-containing protein [Sphingobacteriales bacterium]